MSGAGSEGRLSIGCNREGTVTETFFYFVYSFVNMNVLNNYYSTILTGNKP